MAVSRRSGPVGEGLAIRPIGCTAALSCDTNSVLEMVSIRYTNSLTYLRTYADDMKTIIIYYCHVIITVTRLSICTQHVEAPWLPDDCWCYWWRCERRQGTFGLTGTIRSKGDSRSTWSSGNEGWIWSSWHCRNSGWSRTPWYVLLLTQWLTRSDVMICRMQHVWTALNWFICYQYDNDVIVIVRWTLLCNIAIAWLQFLFFLICLVAIMFFWW